MEASGEPGSSGEAISRGGEMGALIRKYPWGETALGPMASWSPLLRNTVSMMLAMPYASSLLWGPDLILLYNDAALPHFRSRHPQVLGQPFLVAVPEMRDFTEEPLRSAMWKGRPWHVESALVLFEREAGSPPAETYHSWDYIPVFAEDEDDEVKGILVTSKETGPYIIGSRRTGVLRELSLRASTDSTVDAALRSVEEVLTKRPDTPAGVLFMMDGTMRRTAAWGLTTAHNAEGVSLQDPAAWPLAEMSAASTARVIGGIAAQVDTVAGPQVASQALLLPLPGAADAEGLAVLAVVVNPLLPLDDDHRTFLDMLGRQITANIAGARAREHEQRRAEELLELDRAKTAFFNNLSHEFRTPLTLILGPVEDSLRGETRALAGEALELVRRNALRLSKMVNALLDFARMEARRSTQMFAPVDLAAFTADLASTFRSAAQSAGLTLAVDCQPLPEPIYVDVEMWEKIVLNLLSNALKYTRRGTIGVSLRCDNADAVLEVHDTGVGIPHQELPHLFQRFHRIRSTEGRSHEGTGIGLALVKELVLQHGGNVMATSALGEGSCFTVRVPRGRAHLPLEHIVQGESTLPSVGASATAFVEEAHRWMVDSATFAAQWAESPTRDIAGARVLVADDNADLRAYVASILSTLHLRLQMVSDGGEALAAMLQDPPDLLLADVMMPRLDGFALVRRVRAEARTRAVPIILLSARAGVEAAAEGLAVGADDYLIKPFSALELLARVQGHLKLARIRREVVRHELMERELQKALHIRDEFLALAAHELRTPLTTLRLQADRLVKRIETLPRNEFRLLSRGAALRRQLSRLEAVTEDLLQVSTLTAGSLRLRPHTVELASAVETALEQLADVVKRTNTLVELRAEAVQGHWDENRLQQVVKILLDNALKFGAGKTVQVVVDNTANAARIRVIDQGIGIAPADHARIFKRFERAVPLEYYGGLGIGLWVARQIMRAMGGAIKVDSALGQGATFTLLLPRAPSGVRPTRRTTRDTRTQARVAAKNTEPQESPRNR